MKGSQLDRKGFKGFWDRLMEYVREQEQERAVDEARKLRQRLVALGIDAKNTDEEENGVIQIVGSPIRWIHVMYTDTVFSNDPPGYYHFHLIIPESRPLPRVDVKAVKRQGLREVLGTRLPSLRWEGTGSDLGLTRDERLDTEVSRIARYDVSIALRT
jgi:hypothetical protein